MKASRLFTHALLTGSILMNMTPSARAQAWNTLAPETVQSAVYSRAAKTVVLSVVEENGSGRFVKCEVPSVANPKDLTLKHLFSCMDIPGTLYIASEDSVAAINRSFNVVFERNVKEAQRDYMSRRESEFGMVNRLMPVLFFGGAGLSFGVISQSMFKESLDIRSAIGRNAFRTAAVGAGILAAGSALTTAYIIYKSMQERPLVPLEDGLKKEISTILQQNQKDGFTQLDADRATDMVSSVVLEAYIRSVKDAVRMANSL